MNRHASTSIIAQRESSWRDRLSRHACSGKMAVTICRDEAVSTATFYGWRARLRVRDDASRPTDGLYALARHRMQQDPATGNLFAFINRRATQIKVLYFDRTGWCVWAKRLEQGRLLSDWDAVTTREMDWTANAPSAQ